MDDFSETFFKHNGVLWMMTHYTNRWEAEGPYCSECKTELFGISGAEKMYTCANLSCGRDFTLERTIELTKKIVTRLYESKMRENFPVVSLDLPVGRVGDRAEDENYWVESKLGQKNGKKTAMVLFGDKSKRQDGKSQIFVDLEDGQVRFHAVDAHPTDVACKVIVEFPDSKTTIEKK